MNSDRVCVDTSKKKVMMLAKNINYYYKLEHYTVHTGWIKFLDIWDYVENYTMENY